MNLNKLFVHCRYLKSLQGEYPIYIENRGILKSGKLALLKRSKIKNQDYWYSLEDLPLELQDILRDVAITYEELMESKKKKTSSIDMLDGSEVKLRIDRETPILPIVGNFLPRDGVNAYTVTNKDGSIDLKPIIICWGCHWSELFTGSTKYGHNVFCLASDLNEAQIANFIDDIIPLKDAPKYLEEFGEAEKEKTI